MKHAILLLSARLYNTYPDVEMLIDITNDDTMESFVDVVVGQRSYLQMATKGSEGITLVEYADEGKEVVDKTLVFDNQEKLWNHLITILSPRRLH